MASISCGNCKKTHGSVQDVRSCYAGESVNALEEPRATDKQIAFLEKLQTERGLPLVDDKNRPSIKEASAMISDLLATPKPASARKSHSGDPAWQSADGNPEGYGDPQPYKPTPRQDNSREDATKYADIPAGHYAVPSLTGNNDLDFFRVDVPTEGTWVGRLFVKRVIGGKPDVNVRGRTKYDALDAIRAAGPAEAAQKYGQEIGRCSKCNRHLTDQTSRQLGIGPDCRSQNAA